MTVTIKDIAKKANVSITTVSRVLNNKPEGIGDDTRKKVLKIIEELDYRPNVVARSMITKKTSTIGLVIPDIRNPFFPELVRGIEYFFNKKKYNVFLCNSDGNVSNELNYLKSLREKNVEGIIYTHAYEDVNKEVEKLLTKSGVPTILIDRKLNNESIGGVFLDNIKGAYLATNHLIDLSHTKIGCITGPSNMQISIDRLTGYKKALNEAGIQIDSHLIYPGDFRFDSGYNATKKILKNKSVTAIFASNDLMAFGVYTAAAELGIKIPEELSIVGFDNIQYNQLLTPKLTTVEQPMYKMGEIAADLLYNHINKKDGDYTKNIMLDPKLIIQNSTTNNYL